MNSTRSICVWKGRNKHEPHGPHGNKHEPHDESGRGERNMNHMVYSPPLQLFIKNQIAAAENWTIRIKCSAVSKIIEMQCCIENNPTSESDQCFLKQDFECLNLLFLKQQQAMPSTLWSLLGVGFRWKFFSSKLINCLNVRLGRGFLEIFEQNFLWLLCTFPTLKSLLVT